MLEVDAARRIIHAPLHHKPLACCWYARGVKSNHESDKATQGVVKETHRNNSSDVAWRSWGWDEGLKE